VISVRRQLIKKANFLIKVVMESYIHKNYIFLHLSQELQHIFQQSLDGNVWKIVPFPDHPKILIEIRDQLDMAVSGKILSTENGEITSHVGYPEGWWTSVSAIIGENILLVTYPNDQQPDEKKYFLVEPPYSKPHPFDFKEPIPEITPARHMDIQLPMFYSEPSEYFAEVRDFLLDLTGHTAVKGCEYLEYGHIIVISFYLYTDKQTMENYLLVLNKKGEVLLKKVIGRELTGIGLDTLILVNGTLIVAENKSIVNGYRIQD